MSRDKQAPPERAERADKPAAALAPAERLGELAERCALAVTAAKGKIAETLALAEAVQELRKAVLPLVPRIRPLIGSPLGFRTDRDTSDKGPYPDAVVADVLVEAVGRGLRWTGNEFNVIGGRLYTTKEGYSRLVGELPGLSDLELTPAVPRMGDGGAVVKYKATWKLDGAAQSLEREIPTRLNAGMGADAAIGKATRKMLASVHARVTGSTHSFADSDAEDLEQAGAGSKASALAERLALAAPQTPMPGTEFRPAREPEKEPVGAARGSGPAPRAGHVPGVDDPGLDGPGELFPNGRGLPD